MEDRNIAYSLQTKLKELQGNDYGFHTMLYMHEKPRARRQAVQCLKYEKI